MKYHQFHWVMYIECKTFRSHVTWWNIISFTDWVMYIECKTFRSHIAWWNIIDFTDWVMYIACKTLKIHVTWWNIIRFTDWVMYIECKTFRSHITWWNIIDFTDWMMYIACKTFRSHITWWNIIDFTEWVMYTECKTFRSHITWWNIINFIDWMMYIECKTIRGHVTYQLYWCPLAPDHPPLKPHFGHLPWLLIQVSVLLFCELFSCFPCICSKEGTTSQSCTWNLPLPQVPVDSVLLTAHSEWVTACGWLRVGDCVWVYALVPQGKILLLSHTYLAAPFWPDATIQLQMTILSCCCCCAPQWKTRVIPTSDVSVRIHGRRDGATILHPGAVGGGDVEGSPGGHLFSHMVNSQLANRSAPRLGPLLTGGWGQSETHFILHRKKLHH